MSRSAGCFHRREASTWDRREASTWDRRGGFSLIELLLVVMVLGILAAMVTPELAGSRQEALLRAAARQLVGTFRLAYSQAVTTQQTVTFLWNPSDQRYRLEATRNDLAGTQQDSAEGATLSVPGSEGQVDSRVTVRLRTHSGMSASTARSRSRDRRPAAGSSQIAFQPLGTADMAELALEDQEGFTILLRVDPMTSRVTTKALGRKSR